jgi:deoxyribonuclease IV
MRLGLHIATAGNVLTAPKRARDMGAETIQLFASNPRGWRPSVYSLDQGKAFQQACETESIHPIWFHMIYLVSYGTPDDSLREKSVTALTQTLASAEILGAKGVVTHMGSHKGLGTAQALERLTESLNQSLDQSPGSSFVCLENSAGGGGNIGNSLEELATILDAMKGHSRLAICIDTAHALTSGYEIRTASGLDQFLSDFKRLIGLDRLVVMHLNDSKADIGTHVDRHENIGHGYISDEAMARIINHPLLQNISGVLEVPGIDGKSGPDRENMQRLLSLRTAS